jgi:diguanylate cyclase (GGDEF)-like protein
MEKENNWSFSETPKTAFVVYVKGVIFLCISGWLAFESARKSANIYLWILYLVFLLHLGAIYFLHKKKKLEEKKLFLLSYFFDVVFITFFLYFTIGVQSDFYLLYFLTIALGSYQLGIIPGLFLSFLTSCFYLIINSSDLAVIPLGNLALRIFFLWILGVFPAFLSQTFEKSKKRLIHTFDLLNERTTELEKSQVQIETIYESSRTLGEILKLNHIIEEILNISSLVLTYPTCSVYLIETIKDKLLLKGKIEAGKSEIYEIPKEVYLSEVIEKVAKTAKGEIIFDLTTAPYSSLESKDYRSQMVAPMLSQGKVVGALETKSRKVGGFSLQDQRTFSILASSAGMAIENALLHQKTEELTITDELTGIYNYRFFVQKLEDELKRAKRYHQPLSLLMIDIDWFKKYNDNYGHLFGNQILRTLTGVIKSCIRDVDILSRYGGEEFVVILPQTSKEDAKNIGERIRQKVEQFEFKDNAETLLVKLTVSLGLATYPENGEAEEELTAKVDQALYLAKGKGKNLICTL